MSGPAKDAHGVEARLASGTAIGFDQEQCPGEIPESVGAGGPDLFGTALKTLWNPAASADGSEQERERDKGNQYRARLDEVDDFMHELLGPWKKSGIQV
jgi:hypothetical protein